MVVVHAEVVENINREEHVHKVLCGVPFEGAVIASPYQQLNCQNCKRLASLGGIVI